MTNDMHEENDNGIPEEIAEKVRKIVFDYCTENGIHDLELISTRTDRMLKAVQDGIDQIILVEERMRDRK